MNYEEFKSVVESEFMNYMPEELQHLKLNICPVLRVNETKDALTFWNPDKTGWVSPTIYVNDLYERYKELEEYPRVFQREAEEISKIIKEPPVSFELDWKDAKENIVIQLINTEQNKELLKDMPHREFHDLSIVYRWVVGKDEQGIYSAMIKNDHMKSIGLDEEQLYRVATENYARLFPPVIRSMDDFMEEMFTEYDMPEEVEDMVFSDRTPSAQIWIITNTEQKYGATSMIYDDVLHRVARRMHSDLYILPSSIHETLAVSVNIGDAKALAEMVNEINMSQVDLAERLSNQVYHYDRRKRTLTMATNTPHKRLDEPVAQPQLIKDSVPWTR